jgi:hypothetical protein
MIVWLARVTACRRPCSRPVNSATLFVVSPKYPAVSIRISPSEFLITAPYPAGPGFPFEAPSKFIFMKPLGGGNQVTGLGNRFLGGLVVTKSFKLSC